MDVLGIDVGGSGIKGAPVNTETGAFLAERFRVETPEGARPQPVAQAVAEVVQHFQWHGLVGCGFPAAIHGGTALTAANIHKKWVGTNVAGLFSETSNCTVHVVNDADAAGMAEMAFGAGKGRTGVVLIVTIGTGLGTALFTNGHLVSNTELGHIEINGEDAEKRATDAARRRDKITWEKWARRFDVYLNCIEKLLWPDLIILGGGGSKKFDSFASLLTVQAEVVPAQLLNDAGIVGAALAAAIRSQPSVKGSA